MAMTRETTALREKYGAVFDIVAAILFEADPIDINYKTNTDEYEPEVGTILPRLEHVTSAAEVQQVVYEEFCRWFDAEQVGPRENYGSVAEKIWQAWCGSSHHRA